MKVIYHGTRGCYLAVIAATVHLNILNSTEELPAWSELENLPYFDARQKLKLGQIVFVGKDQLGNEVYILGSGKVGYVIEKTVQGLSRVFEIEDENLFVDLTESEGKLLKLGVILKKISSNIALSDKLIYNDLVRSFSGIVKEVDKIKQGLKGKGEE